MKSLLVLATLSPRVIDRLTVGQELNGFVQALGFVVRVAALRPQGWDERNRD